MLTIQMKAIVQNFPVVLFIMLNKVVLTFESMNQNSKQNHSNESYLAMLLRCAVCEDGSYF